METLIKQFIFVASVVKTTIQDQDHALQDQDDDQVSQDQDLQKVVLNSLKTKIWSWG